MLPSEPSSYSLYCLFFDELLELVSEPYGASDFRQNMRADWIRRPIGHRTEDGISSGGGRAYSVCVQSTVER